MPQVITSAVIAVATFVANAFAAAGLVSFGAFAGNLILAVGPALLNTVGSLLIGKLLSPKPTVAQRQAQNLELTLGESPREAVFGRAATGGVLLNAWNDGPDNDYETLVIKLADHEIDAIEGFYNHDTYYPLTAQGPYNHADFKDDHGNSELEFEWRLGVPGDTVCPIILNQGTAIKADGAPAEWTAQEAAASFKGLAYIIARYHVSDDVWTTGSGRPQFRFVIRGHKNYDPRKDSTVPGGSGAHRWDDPTTREWDENARTCHYNYMRGVWNYAADPPQLMVGPGKSEDEAPPEEAIAAINVCDENVALKAGGTEKRYRVTAIVRANERWIDVEDDFAQSMGGQLVERSGTIDVDVGAAKTPSFTFTDKDLISGAPMAYRAKTTRDELVNTVVARYVEPARLWEQETAPMRRSIDDITTDREPRELGLELAFVFSQTQAQRIAEIYRRKARMQMTATVVLGPAQMLVEQADWGTWTSQRRFGGDSRTVEVLSPGHDNQGITQLSIKQTGSSIYSWNPAVDELDAEAPAYLPPGALAPAEVRDFEAEPLEITSLDGVNAGAIRATWTPPSDLTIAAIALEFRPKGSPASVTVNAPPSVGEYVISVLPVTDVDYEIRAKPLTIPKRDALTTAWREVLLSVPFTAPQPPLNFTAYQTGDNIRFVWTEYPDTTLRYEIRCGPTFDLGRFVANVAGGAAQVTWPIASEDDDLLFWIKTVHRSGVYSEQAALYVASPNDLTGRNFVLAEDFQADVFPGTRHDLFDAYVGDQNVLELTRDDDGIAYTRGDYYTSVALLSSFNARTWLEHRASAYVNDTGSWESDDQTWDDDEQDWLPDIGDPGGDAQLDAFIALNDDLPDSLIEGFRFNDTLTGARSTAAAGSSGITYAPAKTANGVVVAGSLEYEIPLEATFSKLLDVRLQGDAPTTDKTLIELTNGSGDFLRVIWRAEDQRWVLEGNYAAEIAFDLEWIDDDTVSIGVWQSETQRGLVMASRQHTTPQTSAVLLQ